MLRSRNPPKLRVRARRSRGRQALRSAVLALCAYALGLLPFYFLTPVHEAAPALLGIRAAPEASQSTIVADAHPTKPTPSSADVQRQVGADTAPVVDVNPPADTTPIAVPTEVAADPRYAFILLGYGGEGHDGAYLTDSMMVVVVNPDQKTLTLVSIPRDSWVPLLFDGRHAVYDKLNTAYAFAKDLSLYPDRLDKYTGASGAGVFTTDTVSRLLGIPVRYYLGLDFAGFRQMINAVGGVDVDVPASFASRYPANDNPSIDASWTVVRFTRGPQHLSGERAIQFARAREVIDNVDEGSDFARSRRQRLIIEAFKARLFQPGGLLHLPQLLPIAASHLDTNYAVPDVAKLSQLALDWKDVKIYQTALTNQNYLEEGTGPDGTYLLVPNSSSHSWAQIAALMRRLWKDPATGVQIAGTSVQVENDSGVPGAATRVSAALVKLGYRVLEPTAGTIRQTSRILDRSSQGAPLVTAQLSADLGAPLDVVADTESSSDNTVVLQLGADNPDLSPIVPLNDTPAPLSITGVLKFGIWDPGTGDVATSPTRSASPSSERLRTVTVTHTASPEHGPSVTGTVSPLASTTPLPTRAGSSPVAVETPTPSPAAELTVVPSATPTLAPTRTPAPIATPTPTLPARRRPTGTPRGA